MGSVGVPSAIKSYLLDSTMTAAGLGSYTVEGEEEEERISF